jgi:pSer/pThr/pTyr-binding forkhead associated (FHA) protein
MQESQGSGPPAASPRLAGRRVVGILVTYSWHPDGRIFPVVEGRNLIGRGSECEIQVPEDPTLSNVNSHITYRGSFTLGDMVSMRGTYLNGQNVDQQFVPLSNGARITTGSTQWMFIEIPPVS